VDTAITTIGVDDVAWHLCRVQGDTERPLTEIRMSVPAPDHADGGSAGGHHPWDNGRQDHTLWSHHPSPSDRYRPLHSRTRFETHAPRRNGARPAPPASRQVLGFRGGDRDRDRGRRWGAAPSARPPIGEAAPAFYSPSQPTEPEEDPHAWPALPGPGGRGQRRNAQAGAGTRQPTDRQRAVPTETSMPDWRVPHAPVLRAQELPPDIFGGPHHAVMDEPGYMSNMPYGWQAEPEFRVRTVVRGDRGGAGRRRGTDPAPANRQEMGEHAGPLRVGNGPGRDSAWPLFQLPPPSPVDGLHVPPAGNAWATPLGDRQWEGTRMDPTPTPSRGGRHGRQPRRQHASGPGHVAGQAWRTGGNAADAGNPWHDFQGASPQHSELYPHEQRGDGVSRSMGEGGSAMDGPAQASTWQAALPPPALGFPPTGVPGPHPGPPVGGPTWAPANAGGGMPGPLPSLAAEPPAPVFAPGAFSAFYEDRPGFAPSRGPLATGILHNLLDLLENTRPPARPPYHPPPAARDTFAHPPPPADLVAEARARQAAQAHVAAQIITDTLPAAPLPAWGWMPTHGVTHAPPAGDRRARADVARPPDPPLGHAAAGGLRDLPDLLPSLEDFQASMEWEGAQVRTWSRIVYCSVRSPISTGYCTCGLYINIPGKYAHIANWVCIVNIKVSDDVF
jgi:hypothetical protein